MGKNLHLFLLQYLSFDIQTIQQLYGSGYEENFPFLHNVMNTVRIKHPKSFENIDSFS